MFIYWSYGTNRELITEIYPLLCGQCAKLTPHGLVKEVKKARVYGIPVAKWGKSHQTVCGICGSSTPTSETENELFIAVHLRGESIPEGELARLARSQAGAERIRLAWSEGYARFAADPSRYINHNLVQNEEQVMVMAGFVTACLAARELGVHPYESYRQFLFTADGASSRA